MKTSINQAIEQVTEQVIQWRRYLHRHPELSFEEIHTSQFVYDTLDAMGAFEITRPTKTSVVARLKGAFPGKVLAIRADMDALPIMEENEIEFRSVYPGVMHACGHDGHTAVLLGTAKVLGQMAEQLKGQIVFIFQHGEEQPPGGAIELMGTGVLDDVDIIIGAHLWSPLETGKIAVLPGPAMAGGDIFNIKLKGVGGHAGMPHQTVDPVPVAAQIISNLQHIVARQIDPLDNIVISITKMQAGSTHNAIPDTAELNGTVRYFNTDYRNTTPKLMEKVIKGVTLAHGAEYSLEYLNGYLPVINDPKVARIVEESIAEHIGQDALYHLRPLMVGEDFSSYLQTIPGCFIFIGAGSEESQSTFPHHHPRFTIDEKALPIALNVFIHFALDYLQADTK